MTAAIVVTPNRWAMKPDGEHTLVVWHKTAGFFRYPVHVQTGKRTEIEARIPVPEEGLR